MRGSSSTTKSSPGKPLGSWSNRCPTVPFAGYYSWQNKSEKFFQDIVLGSGPKLRNGKQDYVLDSQKRLLSKDSSLSNLYALLT